MDIARFSKEEKQTNVQPNLVTSPDSAYCYLLVNNMAIKYQAEPEEINLRPSNTVNPYVLDKVEYYNSRVNDFNELKSKHQDNLRDGFYDKLFHKKGAFNGIHPKDVIENFIQKEKIALLSKEIELKTDLGTKSYELSSSFEKLVSDDLTFNAKTSQVLPTQLVSTATRENIQPSSQRSSTVEPTNQRTTTVKLSNENSAEGFQNHSSGNAFIVSKNQMKELLAYNQNGGTLREFILNNHIEPMHYENTQNLELLVKSRYNSVLENRIATYLENKIPAYQNIDTPTKLGMEHENILAPYYHEDHSKNIDHSLNHPGHTEHLHDESSSLNGRDGHDAIHGVYGFENYFYSWSEIENYSKKHHLEVEPQTESIKHYLNDSVEGNKKSIKKDLNADKKIDPKVKTISPSKKATKKLSSGNSSEMQKVSDCYKNTIAKIARSNESRNIKLRELFRDELKQENLLEAFEMMSFKQRREIKDYAIDEAQKMGYQIPEETHLENKMLQERLIKKVNPTPKIAHEIK